MVEESIARKKKTSDANLFLVPFDRYNLSESMPLGTVCFEFLSCEMSHVTKLKTKKGIIEGYRNRYILIDSPSGSCPEFLLNKQR